MACEDETTLLKFVAGELGLADSARVERHLDTCADCRQLVAIAAQSLDSAGVQTQPEGVQRVERNVSLTLKSGETFGRYKLERPIARGGMGVVWAAYDPQLHRRVALKLITQRLGDDGDQRLLREAQAMGQLAHPNVVGVYDAGEVDGAFFIAMELVEGQTLRAWLAKEERPWREIVSVFREAGKGLAAAHAVGLVHRDFKPDNVLIATDNKVRVTDFGLVRSSAAPQGQTTPLHAQLTQNGMLMGSAGYMAPELLAFTAATAASDQFSFCVALYEGLYRVLPFRGESLVGMAVAAKDGRLQAPPADSAVPAWVFEVLKKGLAAEPAERFASLDALLDALKADATGRRGRSVLIGAGAVALAVIATVVWATAKPSCKGLERELNGAWDPSLAKKAQDAFVATGKPNAADTWGHAASRLQRFADAWVEARTAACTAGADASRFACLDDQRAELKTLVDAFASADGAMIDHAANAVAELGPPEVCATPPPYSEAERPVREELARVRTLFMTGRAARAAEAAMPIYAQAMALKSPRLIAEVSLVLGEARHALGMPECIEAWDRGASAAATAGDDPLLLELLSHLIVTRVELRRTGEARAMTPMAEGVAARIHGESRAVGRVLLAMSFVEQADGKREAAMALERAALDRLPKDSLDAARAHASLADQLREAGQADAAKAEHELAQAIDTDIFGKGAHAER